MKIRRLTDTGEWTTRRYLSLVGNLLIWIIVAIDAWYLWPTQLGGDTSIVVVSGKSMEPTYFGGDLVIARKMEPSVGDVIVYAPAGLGGSQIVHRIIGGNAEDGWRMQGDNNSFVDPFTPKGDEVKGVVLVHYANFGRVTVLLLNPMVWAFILLAAMVMMLWWSGDDCDDDEDDGDAESTDRATDPDPEDAEEPDLIDRVVEGTEAAAARMGAAVAAAGAAMIDSLRVSSRAPRHAAVAPRHASPTSRFASAAVLRVSAAFAVVGLVTVFGPSVASASQLTVNVANQASLVTNHKCGDLTLAASPQTHISGNGNNWQGITVTGFVGDCVGASVAVDVYRNGAFEVSASGEVSGVTTTLSTDETFHANNIDHVVVKVDGWLFLATWSVTPPPPPPVFSNCVGTDYNNNEVDCTITFVDNAGWGDLQASDPWWAREFLVSPSVSSWSADISVAAIDWVSFTPGWLGGSGTFEATSCNLPQASLQSTGSSWGGHLVLAENGPAGWGSVVCP